MSADDILINSPVATRALSMYGDTSGLTVGGEFQREYMDLSYPSTENTMHGDKWSPKVADSQDNVKTNLPIWSSTSMPSLAHTHVEIICPENVAVNEIFIFLLSVASYDFVHLESMWICSEIRAFERCNFDVRLYYNTLKESVIIEFLRISGSPFIFQDVFRSFKSRMMSIPSIQVLEKSSKSKTSSSNNKKLIRALPLLGMLPEISRAEREKSLSVLEDWLQGCENIDSLQQALQVGLMCRGNCGNTIGSSDSGSEMEMDRNRLQQSVLEASKRLSAKQTHIPLAVIKYGPSQTPTHPWYDISSETRSIIGSPPNSSTYPDPSHLPNRANPIPSGLTQTRSSAATTPWREPMDPCNSLAAACPAIGIKTSNPFPEPLQEENCPSYP
eukprot:gene11695-24485_t